MESQSETLADSDISHFQQLHSNLKESEMEGLKALSVYAMEKIDAKHELTVSGASKQFVEIATKTWRLRTCVLVSKTLHLKIKQAEMPKQFYEEKFESLKSIILEVNGELVENMKGVHISENHIVREGTSTFMMIYHEMTMSRYVGEILEGKQHGNGIYIEMPTKKIGSQYRGHFQKNKKEGYGVQICKNGSKYEGDWKNNMKNGKGKEILYNLKKKEVQGTIKMEKVFKSSYQGQFENDMRNGKGIQTTVNGVYDGYWKDNLKHGQGILKFSNGDEYNGGWELGCRCGEGIYKEHQKKNVYKGEFKNNEYQGKGTIEYENGDRYQGQFHLSKRHGVGTYSYQDGDYYEGEWSKGLAEGKGISMINGKYYQGQFFQGSKNGLGEETDEEGNQTKGIWQAGVLKKKIQVNGEDVPQEEQQQY